MRKIFGFFCKKTYSPHFQHHFFSNFKGNFQKYKDSFVFINKKFEKLGLSLEKFNNNLMKNIQTNQNSISWQENNTYNEIFKEIEFLNQQILELMNEDHFLDNISDFTKEIKKEDIFNLLFNRILNLIHKNKKLMAGKPNYDKEMKTLAILLKLISNLIYFPQGFTKENLSFLSDYLQKKFNNGLIYFNFDPQYKQTHDLLKTNFLNFLEVNLEVQKLEKYNFLNKCEFNFGSLLSQINEYLLTYQEKIKLSQILLTYLRRNLLGEPNLFLNNLNEKANSTEILLICLKNQSENFFENISDQEYAYLVKYPEYYIQAFKQINDYFIFMINEKKSIEEKSHFKTIMKILRLNPENLYFENLFYYIEQFTNDNKSASVAQKEKKNVKQIKSKINFILEILKILTSSYAATEEKSESLINFFQKSYQIISELLRSPEFHYKYEKDTIFSIYQVLKHSKIISLELLSLVEERLQNNLQLLTQQQFFEILIFYTQCPLGLYPTKIRHQIMHYIRTNIKLFDYESLSSLGLAILQIGFNKMSGLFDIFLFIDHEIWGELVSKIMGHNKWQLSKKLMFKLYFFAKLANFDTILKKDTFEQIAKNYEKEILSFDTRMVSQLQEKFADMLNYAGIKYVSEPPLIEKTFAVDFLFKQREENVIIEINGPKHYWTVFWENEANSQGILEKLEEKSEIWDSDKKIGIVETRYTSLKSEILSKLGYTVLNFSYINLKNQESKESLYYYFLDYWEMKNKKIIKKKYFNNQ